MPKVKHTNIESSKIFGIGFNKTGTTTLKRCYKILDLTPVAPNGGKRMRRITHKIFDEDDYGPLLKCAERYKSFEDRPWNVWKAYQHLDQHFPDSRFILTVREPQNWWRSVERWISVSKPWMTQRYRAHLKSPNLLPESMIDAYLKYNREVTEYFAGTDQLLVIDFESGQGWQELCDFLDLPVPSKPFPHANSQTYGERDDKRRVYVVRPYGTNGAVF